MAIPLNDNLSINAPKLADDRSKKANGLAYTSKADVLTSIVASRRAVGLIVLINTDLYYFKTGTTFESDLVKISSGDLPTDMVLSVTGDLVDNSDESNPVIVFNQSTYDIANFANASSNQFVRQLALDNKVDKIPGRGLSEANYTNSEKAKLTSIEPNAQVNKLEKIYLDGTELPITDKSVFMSSGGDRLVNVGNIILDVDELTLTTGFKWVLGGIFYENLTDWVNIINYTSDTLKKRKDIIVGTQSGSFQRIQGVESETIPIRPVTPPNTILVTTLDVFFDSVNNPTPPITDGLYEKKDLYIVNIDSDGVVAVDPILADNVKNINLTVGFTEDIEGFAENNSGNLYPRMPLIIQNNTGSSVNVIHNGSAYYKLFFPNEQNYVLEDKELLLFYYRDNSDTIFDFVSSNNFKSTFETDTTVVLSGGKSLGKYTNGQTIPSAGKTFEEVIKDIALEYVNPSFSSFTISGQPTTVEVGTTLSGSKTFNWGITLNSGIVPTIDIYDNTAGAILLAGTTNDGTQSQTITTIQLNSNGATQSWKGIANNSNGANVNSSNFIVTSLYNRFWGAVATLPASSVDGTANRTYANLLSTAVKTNGTNTFTLVTGTTSNKFIVLLPPGITITSVIDTGNLNLNITSSYVLSTITIKDAGGTDRTYNQYLFNPAGVYPSSTNHVITTN